LKRVPAQRRTDMTDLSVGDFVVDTEADHDKKLVVVGVPGARANEWTAYTDHEGNDVTIAEDNPEYPEDALVVTACFLDDERNDTTITDLDVNLDEWDDEEDDTLFQRVCDAGVRFYAFPEGRLEAVRTSDETEDTDDEPPRDEVLDEIRAELERLGWKDVHVDEEDDAVVVEKFGEHRVYADGTVESDRDTLREKLRDAVAGVV